jgi:hypothetical protein
MQVLVVRKIDLRLRPRLRFSLSSQLIYLNPKGMLTHLTRKAIKI